MDGNATFDRYREQAANQGAAKPPPSKRQTPQVPTPDLVSAADLLAKDFKPVKWTIPGLLPVGVTLLAGAPKTGKSWLVLDFGIAVASGGAVLGKVQVDPGAVLYLALEDNQRRLKSRLSKRLGGAPAPDGMTFSTVWPRLDQGAIDRLADWLAEHPDTALIVLDTLARIRPPSKGRDSLYTEDYAIGAPLLQLAAAHEVAIVLVHHTRKGEAEDPLELISGSTGLTGGVDNIMVLRRTRGTNEATLFVTGRDIENEAEYGLTWDAQIAGWTVTGQGPHVGLSPERRAVFDIVADHGPIEGRDITSLLHPGVAITRDSKEWRAVRKLLKALESSSLIHKTTGGFVVYGSTSSTGSTQSTSSTGSTQGRPEPSGSNVEPGGTDGVDGGSTLQAPDGVGSGECGTGWNQWNRIPENQGTRLVTCRACGHWRDRCAEGENATDPEFPRTCPKFTALITREAAA